MNPDRRPRTRPHSGRLLLLLALAPLATGCTQQVQRGEGVAAVAPMLSVERFLQASNARDFEAMARLFGTPDGPVGDTGSGFGCAFKKMGSWIGLSDACMRREEVELRMAAIAEILRHHDYKIVSEGRQPGRSHPTNRIGVDLTQGRKIVRDVSFLVVRTGAGAWLVQEIDLEKVTNS